MIPFSKNPLIFDRQDCNLSRTAGGMQKDFEIAGRISSEVHASGRKYCRRDQVGFKEVKQGRIS
jgi:hypothetical protein